MAKVSGTLKMVGFANMWYMYVYGLTAEQYYGTIHLVCTAGTASYVLNGYDGTSTDTTSTIKTYKHQRSDGKYDFQIVFPSHYVYGSVVLGGGIAAAGIVEFYK